MPRFTAAERDRLRAAAGREPIAAFIRRVVLDYLRRRTR